MKKNTRDLLTVTLLGVGLAWLLTACFVSYDSHDEWNCTPISEAKACTADIDCGAGEWRCVDGFCLDKKVPEYSACAQDGYFKPVAQACGANELLCESHCVPSDRVRDFPDLCCPGGCAEGSQCCASTTAEGASISQCVPGGCACEAMDCATLGAPSCCDGVCVDMQSSRAHCGACFNSCPIDNACFLGSCTSGFLNVCCGIICDDCTVSRQYCAGPETGCQSCTLGSGEEQCDLGQSCVPETVVVHRTYNDGSGFPEETSCATSNICVDADELAIGGDCEDRACAEGLNCVNQVEVTINPGDGSYNTSTRAWSCRQNCLADADCSAVSGTICHRFENCEGFCAE